MTAFSRFLEPPRLRTASAERYEERHATWLELFFDLVFVVAIAELGTSFAHRPTAGGFFVYLALFVPVWWAWAGFAFYATRFDTDDLVYRVLTLLGMFGVAALATQVPDAFVGTANGFALVYALIRSLIVALYARAWWHVREARPLAAWFALMFSAAIGVWLLSLAVPSPAKFVLWGVALALELSAPPRAWTFIRHAPIHPAHIPERFGLLTIIVLGEAVIAVVLGTVDVHWSAVSGSAAFAAFGCAAGIWWIYFEFFDTSVASRGVFQGMTYVYAHYAVAVGIAALGVGARLAIVSAGPGDRYAHVGWIAGAGTALCMLGLGVIQLVTPPTVFDRDVALRATAVALACALAALTAVLSPVLTLWLLACILLAQVVYELAGHETHAGAARGAD